MPNGIDLILADHQRVNDLFAQSGESPDGALIGQVVDSLHAHDDAEHGALYPMASMLLGDDDVIVRSAAAHSMVHKQIDYLNTLEGPPLVEAFKALQVIVTDHVNDEETNLLPALAAKATPQQLEGLGARILQIKQRVG